MDTYPNDYPVNRSAELVARIYHREEAIETQSRLVSKSRMMLDIILDLSKGLDEQESAMIGIIDHILLAYKGLRELFND